MTRKIFALFSLAFVLGATEAGQAITPQCSVIENACLTAGFTASGAKKRAGKGLWLDCINPIMQGTTSKTAKLPLPNVDPAAIAACKQSSPKFGSGKVGD